MEDELKKLPKRYWERPNGPWFKEFSQQEMTAEWGKVYDFIVEKKLEVPVKKEYTFDSINNASVFMSRFIVTIINLDNINDRIIYAYSLFRMMGYILWLCNTPHLNFSLLLAIEKKMAEIYMKEKLNLFKLTSFNPVAVSLEDCLIYKKFQKFIILKIKSGDKKFIFHHLMHPAILKRIYP